MAKTNVTLLKPLGEKRARIELGFSKEDFDLVKEYEPRALKVIEKDSGKLLFEVMEGTVAGVGKHTLLIPRSVEREGNMLFTIENMDRDVIADTAALANVVNYGDIIAKQVATTVAAYNKAKESILVEGAETVKPVKVAKDKKGDE